MAAKKKKRCGHIVQIRTRGIRISLAGPKDMESQARSRLEFLILTDLNRCSYFKQSGMAPYYAEQIANKTKFQAWKDPRRKGFKNVVTVVHSLDIFYRNPPCGWKWWVKIRDQHNEVMPGESAAGEVIG